VATPNKLLGGVFGGVYVLIGLVGFLVSSGVGFAATEGKNLIIFEINPLHNVVHLLVGALLIYGFSRGEKGAAAINMLVGGVYLVVGVIGLFILGASANILALNGADNVLHLLSAVLLVGVPLATRSSRSVSMRAG
jgi:hypothetical protein